MQMSEINQLPNRNFQSFQKARKIKLTTNLYEIRLDKLKATFFRYDFITKEGEDSLDKLLIFKELKGQKELYQNIGFVCEFKEGLIGSKRVDEIIEVFDKPNTGVVLKLKLTKSLNIEDLLGEQSRYQVLNHLILPLTKKCEEGGDRSSKPDSIGDHKILIAPKCTFSFVQLKKKLYLATNVSINIREMNNLYSYFQRYDKESLKNLLIGKAVVANYGVKHIYTISDIDFTKTPMSLTSNNGKNCTFVDYFKEKYAVTITNLKQPLLVAHKNKKNAQQRIFLVPEIVSLFNSICPHEFNKKMQEKLQRKKWKLPDEKDAYAVKMIKQLGESEVIKKSAHNFDGITLNPPSINIDHRALVPQHGVFSFRGRISRPVQLKNWGIVYVQGKDKELDNTDVSRLVYHMKGVSQQYGIKILNDPGLIQVTGTISDWKKMIAQDIEKYGAPQFLIFLLREDEAANYPSLKQLMINYKFPSQVIKRKTINESKKPFAIIAEILLQIQAKIGATLWELGSNVDLAKRKLMQGGFYLHHEDDRVSISFVGYVNSQCTQTYSYSKKDLKDYSEISFETLTMYWAKNYVMNNKFPPDTIIIYREENQANMQEDYISKELQQIRSAIRKIGEKTRVANYNPSISFITVQRRHRVELYSRSENESKEFTIENPEAGTAVLERHEDASSFDFYLNSSKSLEQTNRPVKFTVVEASGTSAESLVTFTYEQCYNYPNFMGALEVPACLQHAHKLSRFSSETSVQIGFEDKMNRLPYFL